MRAVMTLVPTPRPVASICAPKTPAESRTNRPTRGSAIELLAGRCGGASRAQGVETVLALAQHRLALAADEGLPQPPDGRLERVAGSGERRDVDRHAAHAEPAGRVGERRRRLDGAVVDETLLQVAREGGRSLDARERRH